MKYFILSLLTVLIMSCGSETGNNSGLKSNPESKLVFDFLENVSTLESVESKNPIVDFQESAEKSAKKVVSISKDNIQEVLETAKEYKFCVIVTGNHTIIKILDLNDCKQSGSWGTCMPLAEGYIKNGDLDHKKNYINNIIGLPDDQIRKAYLFN